MRPAFHFSSNFMLNSITVIATAGIFFFCQSAGSEKKASTGAIPVVVKQSASPVVVSTGKASGSSVAASTPSREGRKLIVYYFHSTMRCPTCHKLENYAKSEIEASFPDAIKTGRLEWKIINVEEAGNEHFIDDYKLYTKSVIISTMRDGRELSWKNLDKIWQLVNDEGKYRRYIRDEVRACLEGECL